MVSQRLHFFLYYSSQSNGISLGLPKDVTLDGEARSHHFVRSDGQPFIWSLHSYLAAEGSSMTLSLS